MSLLDRGACNAKAVLMERGHTKSDVARRPGVSEGTRSPSRPPNAGGGGGRPLPSTGGGWGVGRSDRAQAVAPGIGAINLVAFHMVLPSSRKKAVAWARNKDLLSQLACHTARCIQMWRDPARAVHTPAGDPAPPC